MARRPERSDGYAPLRDYAAIGNERVAALVALDGSIDWLCLPRMDSPSAFAAILDPEAGGSFSLRPQGPFEATRRYCGDTNVLETTFLTDEGSARVTDAITIPEATPLRWNELVRRVEGLAGSVPLRWSVDPRFDWGATRGEVARRAGVPAIVSGEHQLTVSSWGAGEPRSGDGRVEGDMTLEAGDRALISLGAFHDEPLLLSGRDAVERRLEETLDYWRRRSQRLTYTGPWREAVIRSALALQLLVYGPTGAIVAAPTCALPERIGGPRNWDYRFSWLRDTAFTLEAMLRLGYSEQVHASLGWLLQATRRTHPRLSVFYSIEGDPPVPATELDLAGYRHSRPVLAGNGAGGQLQLGNYSDLLQMAWLYVENGNALDPSSALRLSEVADLVCELWPNEDSSIWELGQTERYTQGKLGAWLALDRAARLADAGELPARHAGRWRAVAEDVRRFIERHCWSEELQSYVRYPGTDGLDASVLLAARAHFGYLRPDDPRLASTIAAIRRRLGRGPLLYRYSGMEQEEGAFLACSFWLVEALHGCGRGEQAGELMGELVAMGNDVGIFTEEIDPESGELLGNLPQALTHLALVNAAFTLEG